MSEFDAPDTAFHALDAATEGAPAVAAFFACRHFLGALALATFQAKAREACTPADLLEAVSRVLGHAGQEYVSPPSPDLLPHVRRILIAHLDPGRFVTLRKGASRWWNYDAALADIEPISEIDGYLRQPRGDRFWFGL